MNKYLLCYGMKEDMSVVMLLLLVVGGINVWKRPTRIVEESGGGARKKVEKHGK